MSIQVRAQFGMRPSQEFTGCAVAGGIVDALGFGKYLRKDGRFSFQVDYGIAILNYACERAWPDRTKPRPE
jgi:hypothetical protein